MSTTTKPRRFAPLDPSIENKHNAPKLRGIVFDVDGTLCLPQNHMFREMRAALNIPKTIDILDHIRTLSSEPDSDNPPAYSAQRTSPSSTTDGPSQPTATTTASSSSSSPQSRAIAAIKSIERNAMTAQTPQPGLQELMTYLENRGVPKGLCTRNFLDPVQHLLDTYLPAVKFSPVITRESEGVAPKPSPEGIWVCGREWGVDGMVVAEKEGKGRLKVEDSLEYARRYVGGGLVMVGDSVDDLVAGRRAGAATVLLVNEENGHLREREECDVVVARLDELVGVLERGFEGRS